MSGFVQLGWIGSVGSSSNMDHYPAGDHTVPNLAGRFLNVRRTNELQHNFNESNIFLLH